jgi:hypothetical protein
MFIRRREQEERLMITGPVQMLVVGFAGPEFRSEIATEIERLRETDTIPLLDAEDADLPHLDDVDSAELWDVADSIPPDPATAIALIEHRWAIGLRDAIQRAGGAAIADARVSSDDLAALGLTG